MDIYKGLKEVFNDTLRTSIILFKIMIPVSIIVKILEYANIIPIIGSYLGPLMKMVGLPGEFGLVWTTAMITNIYGAIIVFITLASQQVYSVSEVTILCSMILVAHSLPVEVTIARRAGVRVWFTLVLRIFSAFIFGFILNIIFSFFQLFNEPSFMAWQPEAKDSSIYLWIFTQLKNYILIFVIIFLLLILMKILKNVGIIDKLNNIMEPGLEFLGMSKNAASLTIIGTTLGISYGGGLIIDETQSGKISKRDAFLSVSLMGLSHSLIEDTLLMLTLGASIFVILIGRVIFSLIGMVILIQLINRLTIKNFEKYLTA